MTQDDGFFANIQPRCRVEGVVIRRTTVPVVRSDDVPGVPPLIERHVGGQRGILGWYDHPLVLNLREKDSREAEDVGLHPERVCVILAPVGIFLRFLR